MKAAGRPSSVTVTAPTTGGGGGTGDTTPPEIASGVKSSYTGTATIVLSAADALSGLATLVYSLDGAPEEYVEVSGAAFAATLTVSGTLTRPDGEVSGLIVALERQTADGWERLTEASRSSCVSRRGRPAPARRPTGCGRMCRSRPQEAASPPQ